MISAEQTRFSEEVQAGLAGQNRDGNYRFGAMDESPHSMKFLFWHCETMFCKRNVLNVYVRYPLVNIQKLLNIAIYSGFTH
jgi:hypothetical protein